MSGRKLLIGALVGFLLVTVAALSGWQHHAQPQATAMVYVARTDLAPFTLLTPNLFVASAMPRAWVPSDAVTNLSQVAGRYLGMGLLAQSPLRTGHLLPSGPDTPITAALSALGRSDLRALELSLKPAQALAPTLKAGDRVDVVAALRGATAGREGHVIAQDIYVLGVSSPQNKNVSTNEAMVTLACTPHAAEVITQATLDGEVWLAAHSYNGG